MPPGSNSKVKRLLDGRIPFTSQHDWPDGRPASVIVTMHALVLQGAAKEEKGPASSPVPLVPPEDELPVAANLHPFYVDPSFVNTHDEKVAIAFALDEALEAFKAGDEDMASLRELGLPYAALDQGSNLWFSCNQQLADELLLTWSDFESAVCNFLASIRPPDFPWQ